MNTDDEIYKYQPLWGNWYIELPIGKGSFGSVYRISREDMGRKYTAAVKFITVPSDEQRKEAEASLGDDEDTLSEYFGDIVRNIVGEIDMLYALSGNTNIISYQDHEVRKRQQGIGWDILIRMEYVTSLRKYLKEHSMTVEEVIRLGIDICTALETCSKKGIIHRDIKDDNIFVSDDGVFKLGDFGIARELSKSGRAASMRGTPLYMAPEIFRGEKYDATVDIYSLGIVLYKLLNYGRMPLMPPFPDKVSYQDSEDALEKRMSGVTLPPPSLASGMLASVVLKACAYNAVERYSSPTEMKRALIKAFSMLSEVVRAQVVLSAPESSISREKQHTKTGKSIVNSKADCSYESTSSIFGDQQGSSHQDDRPRRTSATIGIFPSVEEQIEQKKHFNWQLDEEDKKRQKKRKRLATFIALFCVVVGCFFLILRFADAELIYLSADGASASNASTSNASASNASASNASALPSYEKDGFIVENGVLANYSGQDGDVNIPDNISTIGNHAFAWCTDIISITIPPTITEIRNSAFFCCYGLTTIIVPDSVTSIGDYAFGGCLSLTSITISESITSIGEHMFDGCTCLISVYIPDSVTRINDYAFNGCTGLSTITISNNVTSIGDYVFDGCENLVMICSPGSYAEEYAKSNGIPFIAQ